MGDHEYSIYRITVYLGINDRHGKHMGYQIPYHTIPYHTIPYHCFFISYLWETMGYLIWTFFQTICLYPSKTWDTKYKPYLLLENNQYGKHLGDHEYSIHRITTCI